MTVVGTVLLDNSGLNHKQELCVQRKAPLIAEQAMIAIIKVNTLIILVVMPYIKQRQLIFLLIDTIDSWNIVVSM
jgi:hypothetical protein